MDRKVWGAESLEEASALCNLANVLRHEAGFAKAGEEKIRFDEAEAAARAGLEIRRKRLGNSDEVASALHTLAMVLHDQRRLPEAEAALRESVAITSRLHGEEHPYMAHQGMLGAVLWQQGKLEEAETYLRKTVEIQERTEGKGKNSQIMTHHNLAHTLQREGKYDEAELHHRQAVTIAKTEMGPDYPDLPLLLGDLAQILRHNGKLTEAHSFAEEAVAICQRDPDRIERWISQSAFNALKEVLKDLSDTAAPNARGPRSTSRKPPIRPRLLTTDQGQRTTDLAQLTNDDELIERKSCR